jgi:hypothetical protein
MLKSMIDLIGNRLSIKKAESLSKLNNDLIRDENNNISSIYYINNLFLFK